MNRRTKRNFTAGAGCLQNSLRPNPTGKTKRKAVVFALGLAGLCLASVLARTVLFSSGPSAAPIEVVDDNAAAEPERPAKVRNELPNPNPRSEPAAPMAARVPPNPSQPWQAPSAPAPVAPQFTPEPPPSTSKPSKEPSKGQQLHSTLCEIGQASATTTSSSESQAGAGSQNDGSGASAGNSMPFPGAGFVPSPLSAETNATQADLPWRLVAQLALQDTNAFSILVAAGTQDKISSDAWIGIAATLVSESLNKGLLSAISKPFTRLEESQRLTLITALLIYTPDDAARQAFSEASIRLGRQAASSPGAAMSPSTARSGEADDSKDDLPWRLLAQLALHDGNASSVLLTHVAEDKVPDFAWTGIAETLVGEALKEGSLSPVSAEELLTKPQLLEDRVILIHSLMLATHDKQASKSFQKAAKELKP